MPSINRTPAKRIFIVRRPTTPPYWVKIDDDEKAFHTLRMACDKALTSIRLTRCIIIGGGLGHIAYLSKRLVETLADGHPLWWEFDGIVFTLIARTVLHENGATRTRRLNQYSTVEFAQELHYSLFELGANIAEHSLEEARLAHSRNEVYLDQKANERLQTLIQQGSLR